VKWRDSTTPSYTTSKNAESRLKFKALNEGRIMRIEIRKDPSNDNTGKPISSQETTSKDVNLLINLTCLKEKQLRRPEYTRFMEFIKGGVCPSCNRS